MLLVHSDPHKPPSAERGAGETRIRIKKCCSKQGNLRMTPKKSSTIETHHWSTLIYKKPSTRGSSQIIHPPLIQPKKTAVLSTPSCRPNSDCLWDGPHNVRLRLRQLICNDWDETSFKTLPRKNICLVMSYKQPQGHGRCLPGLLVLQGVHPAAKHLP